MNSYLNELFLLHSMEYCTCQKKNINKSKVNLKKNILQTKYHLKMSETWTKCRLCLKLGASKTNIDKKLSEAIKIIFDIEVSRF